MCPTIRPVAVGSIAYGNSITIQGLVDCTGPVLVTIAITGGTGAYRTATASCRPRDRTNRAMSRSP
jgi:hypothetical protein